MYLCKHLITMNEGMVSKKLMTFISDFFENPVFFLFVLPFCVFPYFSVFLSSEHVIFM